MSPHPQDRLLATQALLHPWIKAIEDESDLNPIVDVEESSVTLCDVNEQSQHTQASAVWTQETAKCMDHLADQNNGSLQVSKDDDESETIRLGMDIFVANTTATTEIIAQKRLSGSGRHLEVEEVGERSCIHPPYAEPDKDDYSQFKEPSRPKSNSEAPDPHESTPTNTIYMEDADGDGKPIEWTEVYPDKRRRRPRINNDSGSRKVLFNWDKKRPHSLLKNRHQTFKQAVQYYYAYQSGDGQTQDLQAVDTGPSNHPKVTMQVVDSCSHDRTAPDPDTLTPEYCESNKKRSCELQRLTYY